MPTIDKLGTPKVLNPRTNRYVSIGSQMYRRLVAKGELPPLNPLPVEDDDDDDTPLPPPSDPPPIVPALKPVDLKKKMKAVVADVARDNHVDLEKLSQKEADALLKRLLIARLTNEPADDRPTKAKKKSSPKVKPTKPVKSKKTKKFKIVSSESEASDSDDSESESE